MTSSPPMRSLTALLFVSAAIAGSLEIITTKPATCKRPSQKGDTLSVNYRGTLKSNGDEFDSSYRRNTPFKFKIGMGQVIQGWDKGLLDMCVGEGRKLIIPPEMAYGSRGSAPIPPNSWLIFETELMGIDGVPKEEAEMQPDAAALSNHKGPNEEEHKDKEKGGSPNGPQDEDSGECKLLGPFALLIQGALGILALMSLVWKRWRETPRRPLKVWSFDVSKQVVGSALLHLANLLMSMLSSGDLDISRVAANAATATAVSGQAASFVQDDRDGRPNPCSFYLLNLAIDTTIGIPILVLLLRLLHHLFSLTPFAKPAGSLRSGNYGQPPKASWWLKQSFIYFLGLLGMKSCVFVIFQLCPWLGWVGDWALRWTEGKEWVQITFVMLVFPLIMNALQYYIIDSFIKDKGQQEEGYEHVEQHGEGEGENDRLIGGERRRDSDDVQEVGVVREGIKEPNPTPVPVTSHDSDDEGKKVAGHGSSGRR